MRSWLSDPNFIEDIYIRYMEIAGFELPAVIKATIGEAKRGNVHAARLILEHFGKLENKLKIQVESNFEKFIKTDAKEVEFFEVTDKQNEAFDLISEHVGTDIELPERDKVNNNPTERRKKEKKHLKNIIGLGVEGVVVTGEMKADWIEQNLIHKGFTDILFADDAILNVEAVRKMFAKYPKGLLHKGGKAV